LPTDVATTGVDVERLATQITVRQALATLSEVDRLALTLFYAGGASLREIAAFLDVPLTRSRAGCATRGHAYERNWCY
jgi:DNA-directed RNA polymerase specialized sigma24 family protein